MTEEWRPIARYKYYEVSNLGRVRSKDRVLMRVNRWGVTAPFKLRGRILKPRTYPNGYLGLPLGADSTEHLVHRLVAAAFIKRRPGATQVNHLDGARANNRAENLEWCTCSENHMHSYANLPRKTHAWTRKVLVGDRVFASVNDAARFLKVTSASISSAATRNHRCGGLEVSYV